MNQLALEISVEMLLKDGDIPIYAPPFFARSTEAFRVRSIRWECCRTGVALR